MADAEWEAELIDSVSKPAKRAESSLQRLKKTISRFSSSTIGRATAGLSKIAGIAGTVGAAISSALGAGFAGLTVGMVDFAQRSRQAFSLLAKHGEAPEQLFQDSMALAARLGLDVKDTTKQIQKFRALQFSQNQAEALVKMGSDMQALGASSEEVSRIFAQLGQIKAKDTLQTEELRTLAESGVSTQVVFAALAKQLGKTEDQIKQMISKGEITGAEALNAIGTAILFKTGTRKFGEAGEKIAQETLSGMARLFRSKAQQAFVNVGDHVAPAITRLAKSIFGDLDGLFAAPKLSVEEMEASQRFGNRGGPAPLPPLFQKIADAIKAVTNAIEKATPMVKSFLKGFDKGASEAWETFAAAFGNVTQMLGGPEAERSLKMSESLGKSFGFLAIAVGAVGVAFGGVAMVLTVLTNFILNMLMNFVDNVSETIAELVFPFTDTFANISAILDSEALSIGEKGVAIGKALINGFNRGLLAVAMAPINHVRRIAQGAIDAAKSTLDSHSPSRVFQDIGKDTALGFALGLQDLPVQNVIHSTLGNDNGMDAAPVRGNLSGGRQFSPQASGGGVTIGRVEIKVQGGPGMTPQQMEDQGREAARGFYAELHEFFDDLVLEEAV